MPVLTLRSAENGPGDSFGVLGALERIVLIDKEGEAEPPELDEGGRRTVSGAGDILQAQLSFVAVSGSPHRGAIAYHRRRVVVSAV
jgi:hypothetical protein